MPEYAIASDELVASTEFADLETVVNAINTTGNRPAVCEYIKVTWAAGVVKYYGAAAWHQESPFTAIGITVEPRLILTSKDPFHGLELYPDLKTDSIKVTFNDLAISANESDKVITGLFQTYGSGVRCEFFLYYADQNLHVSIWTGQLQAPQVYGWKKVEAVATNGYRSPEFIIPSRDHRKECTFEFGGRLPDADAVRSNGCPYDRHVGGSVGNFKTGSTPYTDCPRLTEADCVARLGDAKYFGGFFTNPSTVVFDPPHGWLATSKGNESNLKTPVRVVFGKKTVRSNLLLTWLPEDDAKHHENGWVDTIFEICEGPIVDANNIYVQSKLEGWNDYNLRLGTRGQAKTFFDAASSNYSSLALVRVKHGWVDARTITPQDLPSSAYVTGFAEVCVYTDAVTKTRIWSDNRVWCLLELLKNQKFGMGYAEAMFNITDWISAATWSDTYVSFTAYFADGEQRPYTSKRSSFNAILEGRKAIEQITDICRSGGLSLPFTDNGKFTIAQFRKATPTELSNAVVFTDTGSSVNIEWADGQPSIQLSQTPNNKLINEVEVRFEDSSQNDTERPVVVDDRNQKLAAGRQMGPNYLLTVPKSYSAFGVGNLAEAMRLATRLLWFGEGDTGGIQNNLQAKFTVPFEQVLGAKRYSIIKLSSALLANFVVGINGAQDLREAPQYFRILSLKKVSGGRCEVTAQVYNHTAYTAFEVDAGGGATGPPTLSVYDCGSQMIEGYYEYAGQVNGKPSYSFNDVVLAWNNTNSRWEFTLNGLVYYYASSVAADPSLVGIWLADNGELPVPKVVANIVPSSFGDGSSTPTLTYDSTKGVISVTW